MGLAAKIPSRAKVDAYPTIERYGLIFAFLGDLLEDERPPLLEVAEWDREGWRATCTVMEWRANYRRSIENGLDAAHNEFVHTTHRPNTGDDHHVIDDIIITEIEWTAYATETSPGQVLPDEKMR